MKLDTKALRYLTNEDWKVLAGVGRPLHDYIYTSKQSADNP